MLTRGKVTVTRKLEFDAGHRVYRHESKCATLHGHRYVAEITAEAPKLDSIGRVIDFSVIKERIGGWIDNFWDHTTLLFKDDESTVEAVKKLPGWKTPFICPFNPTAENMAEYLIDVICPKLMEDTEVRIVKIKLWETPNCYAEVTREEVR